MTYSNSNRPIESLLTSVLLASCAIPATELAVPTESMRDALQQARSAHRAESVNEVPLRRPMRSTSPPGAPRPVLAPPDIRMAYLYEWVDTEGNKHFGGWVAIPLVGFDWAMTDGSNPPLSPPRANAAESESPR